MNLIKQFLNKNLRDAPMFKVLISVAVVATISVMLGLGIVYAFTLVVVTDSFTDSTKIVSTTTSNVTVSSANSGQVFLSTTTSWTCGFPLVDSRDARIYTTSLVGSQCWMSQNINIGTMVTGGTTQGTSCSSASAIQKYCYDNNGSNCSTYGGLYQWNQAMCGVEDVGTKGICPTGWHIPTHDEWTTLELATCTSGSCITDFPYDLTTTGWRGTNEGTTLKSGSGLFQGLLAGYRSISGSFGNVETHALFWSSLASGSSAWERYLYSGYAPVSRAPDDKADGFSVRCLMD